VLESQHVEYWDKRKSKLDHTKDIRELLPAADMLILCVPSWEVRSFLTKYRPLISKDSAVTVLSKGMEKKSFKFMHEVLAEMLPAEQPIGCLGGPLMAEDILLNRKGFAVFGSASKSASRAVVSLFTGTLVDVIFTQDMFGVALCGVLKNIYAMSIGLADGMKWGDNAKGWLVTQAFHEMAEISQQLGGETATVYSLAGIGDLITSAFSEYSDNRSAGEELSMTGRCHDCEASISIPLLVKRLGKRSSEYPLLSSLHTVIKTKSRPTLFF
jgi:glycerol-3-phosphate dehydrogenase (NAD(P)+)